MAAGFSGENLQMSPNEHLCVSDNLKHASFLRLDVGVGAAPFSPFPCTTCWKCAAPTVGPNKLVHRVSTKHKILKSKELRHGGHGQHRVGLRRRGRRKFCLRHLGDIACPQAKVVVAHVTQTFCRLPAPQEAVIFEHVCPEGRTRVNEASFPFVCTGEAQRFHHHSIFQAQAQDCPQCLPQQIEPVRYGHIRCP